MSDLISRLSELRCQYNCFDENERDAYHTLSEAIKAISAQPEIVRCRECKWHDGIRCFRWNSVIITGFDDFCSNGERRSEDERPN